MMTRRQMLAGCGLVSLGALVPLKPLLSVGAQTTRVQPSGSVSPEGVEAIGQHLLALHRTGRLVLSVYPMTGWTVASTGSMRPAIGDGDFVLCEKAPYDDLGIGDVVAWQDAFRTYRRSDGVTAPVGALHRIWAGKPGAWRTRGDNCTAFDDLLVTPERYQARVVAVLHARKESRA